MNKKVSVIIPTYNSSKWIDRCLQSVLSQDYKNIEIIISDDGSTDDTIEVVKTYLDKKIKIVTSTHGGDAKARNEALKVATGDYLMFVDSDDMITTSRTTDLVEMMEKNDKLLFITTNWFVIGEDNTIIGKGYMPPEEKYRLFVQCLILFGGSFHRREGFGLFDESFPVYSDWFKLCELMEKGEFITVMVPPYLRRQHSDSLSQEYLIEKQMKILKYRRVVWHRFKEQIPTEVWNSLNTGDGF